jgi:hypothetical protein
MISAYLRINRKEEKNLMELSKKLNQERLERNFTVMKESEILHALINEGFKKAKVVEGNIILE